MGICLIENKIYLSYTIDNGTRDGTSVVIDEFEFDTKYLKRIRNILVISYPNKIHHGGHLISTPDNLLILGSGDGGGQGDPENKAQDKNSLRGKLIQITPETGATKILALGLRQPWIFSMDSKMRIWIGNVGWNTSESIFLITDLTRKYNLGWNFIEGSVQHRKIPDGLIIDPPIFEYPTSEKTGRSIIGGFFIDGLSIYIFGDIKGYMRAIKLIDGKWTQVAFNKLGEQIYSIAYDGNNIYVLSDKQIHKLEIVTL